MKSLLQWIPRLAGQRIVVVGDVILDVYEVGRATRMSREAPIPVLEWESEQLLAGGAGNPAANIVALGSTAVQVGVIGADADAVTLRRVLQTHGIDTAALVVDANRPTTVKRRIMAHMGLRFPQQVARMDRLSRAPINGVIEEQIVAQIGQQGAGAQAILYSDYHAGMITHAVVDAGRALGKRRVLLAADAQGELDKYRGFSVVKCNADEARSYLARDLKNDDDFAAAARELCAALKLTVCMAITRGADGITLAVPDGAALHVPAPETTEVYDTVGAGDTAIAVLTLALAAGATPHDAALLANVASGLVVRRVGNYAPTPAELQRAVEAWLD